MRGALFLNTPPEQVIVNRIQQGIAIIATAIAIHLLLFTLPDTLILPLFCRTPATVAAWWFHVPLDIHTLTYTVNGITFEMARSCSAENFFAIATALLIWRAPKWCWGALPLTLILNSLRAILTATLTLACRGWRFEGLVHLTAGATLFIGTLYLLWILTERHPHGH
jgi:hypothetical protein